MTGCPRAELERWALGELSGDEIAKLWRHVARCPGCEAELGALRKERRMFQARAQALSSRVLPPYESLVTEVRSRSDKPQLRGERWASTSLALSMACALAAFAFGGAPRGRVADTRPLSPAPDAAVVLEPAPLCEPGAPICEAPPMSWLTPSPVPETEQTDFDQWQCSMSNLPLCSLPEPLVSSGS